MNVIKIRIKIKIINYSYIFSFFSYVNKQISKNKKKVLPVTIYLFMGSIISVCYLLIQLCFIQIEIIYLQRILC